MMKRKTYSFSLDPQLITTIDILVRKHQLQEINDGKPITTSRSAIIEELLRMAIKI